MKEAEKMVRCKFKCVEKREMEGWGEYKKLYGYIFSPVTGGSLENTQFFAATPAGRFEVSTVVTDAFEVGQEYYLDIMSAQEGKEEVEKAPV